jgi:hypothetical protein
MPTKKTGPLLTTKASDFDHKWLKKFPAHLMQLKTSTCQTPEEDKSSISTQVVWDRSLAVQLAL